MTSTATAAWLCKVTQETIRCWCRDFGIGTIDKEGRGHAKIVVDEVALWLFEARQFEELESYRSGSLPSSRVAHIRSGLGTSFAGDDMKDRAKRYPLLIELSRPMVPGNVRAALFVEAERRGCDPLTVLLDTYAASIADREASK